ncbi:MAG: hypothetical protein JW940_25025 [Polyangiaceae bacterium]|nr:hypothetical protein [Polyangiaceae bacterium]
MSSLRLAQVLLAVGGEDPGQARAPTRFFEEYGPALHAISRHNLFREQVLFRQHPLSCLLRLCDELQEWGRQRVNIEGMVKQLYLAIEGETPVDLGGRRLLSQMRVNLRGERRSSASGGCDTLEFTLAAGSAPHYVFQLDYRDPEVAEYDSALALLSKAYNLQHVDLTGPPREAGRRLRWCLAMRFPRPREYGDLTEYDIYAQFVRERATWLPGLMVRSDDPTDGGQGLLRLEPPSDARSPSAREPDSFAIVLQETANSAARAGWLTCDPGSVADSYLDFKRRYLRARR